MRSQVQEKIDQMASTLLQLWPVMQKFDSLQPLDEDHEPEIHGALPKEEKLEEDVVPKEVIKIVTD